MFKTTSARISWSFAVFPSIVLGSAITAVQLSGNDKAPVFVLWAVVIDLILFVAAFGIALVKRREPRIWLKCSTAAIPLVYVAIVVGLARAGLIDSYLFIGFK